MQCPTCSHHNADDAKFCAQCGTSLAFTCDVCATPADRGAAFCTNCGAALPDGSGTTSELARYLPQELLTKLESARTGRAMHGERRTVTMLFADIQGSTAAAEHLDPEDWAEIINGAFEHLIAPVYRYEGTLARLQGDAVLAFFGAPIAHEDDPVRALRAGLEIVEAIGQYRPEVEARWGIPIDARVGINTGLVVVGEVGSDLRVEYTALGDAINVAARMEQTAQPGTVRVSDHTRSLVGRTFEFEPLGAVDVKGHSEQVVAHRVLRFVEDDIETSGPALVGRTGQLAELDELRSQLGDGAGWVVSLTGDAGVGKSRMLREFHDASAAATSLAHRFDRAGDLVWMTGAGRSYDTATPFAAVRDLLHRWWGLADAMDPYEQVTKAITAAGCEDPDAAPLLSHVGGVELTGQALSFIEALPSPVLHSRAAAAFTSYVLAVARTRPLVIVLEDVHWADDLSLALFEAAMELTEQVPIGVVVAMRPYREDRSWRLHQVAERDFPHRYHPLPLAPLDADDGSALLDALLGERTLSEETRQRILQRAAGNPLFLEETVRAFAESDSDDLVVPSSLASILTARLDRLDDAARYVVQMASVIGSEFDRPTLTALLDRSSPDRELTDLLRRGILVEVGRGMLGFRHVLMQEAAYGTILRKTRRELHQLVAEHLEAQGSDDVQEIARHLVEAGDVDEAFPYLVEAGVRATRAMALADAIRLLSDAIDHTPMGADPAVIVRAHDALGTAHSLVPDLSRAAAAYQQLYDYGERESRPEARVAALNRLGFATASLSGDVDAAKGYLEQARTIATDAGDDVGLAEYHMNACFVAAMFGDLRVAVGHDESTVELGEQVGIDRIRIEGMLRRALNYAALLDLHQAETNAATAREAALAAGAEELAATVDSFASAVVEYWRGDLRRAIDLVEGAQQSVERYGSFYAGINQVRAGGILFELGEPEAALSRYVDARRIAAQSGQLFVDGAAAACMAFVYALAGLRSSIPQLREEAISSLEGPLGDFLASTVWSELGWASLASGDLATAEADLARGLATSSITRFQSRPRLLSGRALALIGLGRLDDASAGLDELREYIHRHQLTAAEPLVSWVEGEFLTASGRLEEADTALTSAHEGAMEMGQRCLLLPVLGARARLAAASGDSDAAEHHRRTAFELIEAIVGSIADETLAVGLRSHWREDLERVRSAPAG
jgi:class 3 adenylate cyclase/tetratricopeptide (TPR) repeat protein